MKPDKNKIALTILIIVIGLAANAYVASTYHDDFAVDEQRFTYQIEPIHETAIFVLGALIFLILTLIGLPIYFIWSYFSEIFYSIPTIGFFQSGLLLYAIDLIYIYVIASFLSKRIKLLK